MIHTQVAEITLRDSDEEKNGEITLSKADNDSVNYPLEYELLSQDTGAGRLIYLTFIDKPEKIIDLSQIMVAIKIEGVNEIEFQEVDIKGRIDFLTKNNTFLTIKVKIVIKS